MRPDNALLIVAVLLLLDVPGAGAQADSSGNSSRTELFPILSYDTDVGFGYGGKMFTFNRLGLRESFDLVLFNSTKGERWYRLVCSLPDFETRQGTVYPVAVDLVIDYDKWIKSSFFGVGEKSRFDGREYYTKEPFEVSLTVGRGFSSELVFQLGGRFRAIRNFNFADSSRLKRLPPDLNASRVSYGSVFAAVRFDTRNSYVNPEQGVVLQGEAEVAPRSSINDVAFSRFAIWAQWYAIINPPKTILAFRTGIQEVSGDDLPVQVLSSVGGSNTLRGSPQDRFLDNVSGIFNAELRYPFFWRFGGVLGLDAGKVWPSLDRIDFTRWTVNPTLGLRFYMDTFVARADVGFGTESTGFYLNFGQLF